MCRVLLERAAEKDLARLASTIQDRVIKAAQRLADNPRPAGLKEIWQK
jgi:mRNA-degrading endonuclease RelE of RelBE toxin-antitoxin system